MALLGALSFDSPVSALAQGTSQGGIVAGVRGGGAVVSLSLVVRDGDALLAVAPVGRGAMMTMRF